MLRHETTVRIGWSKEREDGGEDCYTLTCRVSPGHGGSRDEPPDPGEVEVTEVRSDETGLLCQDMLDEAQESVDTAEAMERASEADYNPRWDDHDDDN